MLTRLLLAGAFGLTLATFSFGAQAQEFGRGFGFGFGQGFGQQQVVERDIFESLILFDEGIIDLFTGRTQAGERDIAEAEELLQAAVSETRFRF